MTNAIFLLAAGCGSASNAQLAALRDGRDAVVPCQERFHEASRTYADCARYIAQRRLAGASDEASSWRTLGALTAGWITADRVGQLGDAEAAASARALLAEASALQQRLHASDADLYRLMGMPSANFGQRRRELSAPDAAP